MIGTEIIGLREGKKLELFQHRGIIGLPDYPKKSVYQYIKEGYKKILAVSPGGSGKTVMMGKVAYDYITKTDKNVFIIMHRKELLDHARNEIFQWFGVMAQRIDADTKIIHPNARIYCCMVETLNNRIVNESVLRLIQSCGLVQYDEAHLNFFRKLYQYYKHCITIGWTATPISAQKKYPLNKDYEVIVVIAEIAELLELNERNPHRGIVSCQGYDFAIDNDIASLGLKMKGNDYDEKQMGQSLSKKKQIQNTINALEKHGKGLKTLIFNADIEHSLKMHNELLYYGFNSQHVDSDKKSKYGTTKHREYIFGKHGVVKGWIDECEDGVLNNVGIATIGTDIKSIKRIVINRKTASFAFFWQMVLRGDRAYVAPDGTIKEYFYLLDMCDNIIGGGHGRFEDPINWEYIFANPKLSRPSVGAVKSCPECSGLNSASARVCRCIVDDWITGEEMECGYEFPFEEATIEDEVKREMFRIDDLIRKEIVVQKTIDYCNEHGKRDGFFRTVKQVCLLFKKENTYFKNYLEIEEFNLIVESATIKCAEWFKKSDTRKYPNWKELVKKECAKELKVLGYMVMEEEIKDGLEAPSESVEESLEENDVEF